jgi:hypothetical protein
MRFFEDMWKSPLKMRLGSSSPAIGHGFRQVSGSRDQFETPPETIGEQENRKEQERKISGALTTGGDRSVLCPFLLFPEASRG